MIDIEYLIKYNKNRFLFQSFEYINFMKDHEFCDILRKNNRFTCHTS